MSIETEQQSNSQFPEQDLIPHRRERGPLFVDTCRALAAISLQAGRLDDRQTYLYWAEEFTPPTS